MHTSKQKTYNFSTKCHVLSSDEVDPSWNVTVLLANMYSLHCVLKEEIRCERIQ